jgi:decaprenylphospho-beta-D-ribofuranose 2-oxidase
VPTDVDGLAQLLDRLDERVLEVGGRLYLAKDSRMRPEHIPLMYPRIDEWRAVRDTLDPDRRLNSDLARRLDLLG